MVQNLIRIQKNSYYQKFLIIDTFFDLPVSSESIFSLIGWLKVEKNSLIRLELFYTLIQLITKVKY